MTSRQMPKKTAIKNYWEKWLVEQGKFDSIIEVLEADYCWACGFIGETDKDDWTERAHIKAKIEGGLDAVENLHLLCLSCHVSSELLDGQDYFDWFKARTVFDVLKDLQNKNARKASASMRTKQGLDAAKARGVVLGAKKELTTDLEARIVRKAAEGASYSAITSMLTAEGITTPRGKAWTPQTVRQVAIRNGVEVRGRGRRKV